MWRNTTDDVGIWIMNGSSITSAPTIGNVGPSWIVVGSGDFDSDGNGDILWRNLNNDLGIWLMNGTTITSAPTVENTSAAWSVASVGDYSGDGAADILLRSSSNDVGIWFMNWIIGDLSSHPRQRRPELDRAERRVELEFRLPITRAAYCWSDRT